MENTTIDTGVNTWTSPTQETPTEPAKAETPAKPVVKESTDRVIPYPRFREVNEKYNSVKTELEKLREENAQLKGWLKPTNSISSEKGAEDETDLDSMSPKELIEYAKSKAKEEAKSEIFKELDAKKAAEKEAMDKIDAKIDMFKEMWLEFDPVELLMTADEKTNWDLDKAIVMLLKNKKEANATAQQPQSEQPKVAQDWVPAQWTTTDLWVSKRNPVQPPETKPQIDVSKMSWGMLSSLYAKSKW